jgi:hypothetical protein
MRGRQPSGPEFVARLDGSEHAKRRVRAVLATLAGTCRVGEACDQLGISEPRFDQIRIEALQAAVTALEPKPTGRPPHVPSEAEVEARQLREKVAELEAALKAALIRTELAVTLPAARGAEAKKAPRPPRPVRRPPWKRPS